MLAFIIFVVYLGGALVLFAYCFMLTPLQIMQSHLPSYSLPILLLTISLPNAPHGLIYEFY